MPCPCDSVEGKPCSGVCPPPHEGNPESHPTRSHLPGDVPPLGHPSRLLTCLALLPETYHVKG